MLVIQKSAMEEEEGYIELFARDDILNGSGSGSGHDSAHSSHHDGSSGSVLFLFVAFAVGGGPTTFTLIFIFHLYSSSLLLFFFLQLWFDIFSNTLPSRTLLS